MSTPSFGIFSKAATFAACVVVASLFIADTVEQTAPEAERLAAAGGAAQDPETGSTQEGNLQSTAPPNGWSTVAEPQAEVEIADYEAPSPSDSETIPAAAGVGFAERRPIPDLDVPEVK